MFVQKFCFDLFIAEKKLFKYSYSFFNEVIYLQNVNNVRKLPWEHKYYGKKFEGVARPRDLSLLVFF